MKDVTLGQYYPGNSLIHRLDPRTKIIWTFLYVLSLFLFENVAGYILVFLVIAGVILASKVPVKYVLMSVRTILFLLLFTVVINMFMTQGEPLFKFGIVTITKEGFNTALYMGMRLIFLVMGTQMMTLTTTPNSLTDGLEKLLRPLNKIGIPVHEIAMMMSIALSFIPILMEETDKIIEAQKARGADFESKNLIKKVKSYIPVLVPLFISAFRRASDLAMAMEARCYQGGEGRTKLNPLKYEKIDYLAFFLTALYFVFIVTVPDHYAKLCEVVLGFKG